MHPRFSIASLLLAGSTLLAAPLSAEPIHHPAAHAVAPRAAIHAPSRPVFHAAVRRGIGRGFGRPGFHPLHAAIVGHIGFAHFSSAQRAAWTHGRWYHRWYNGRYGWWWNAGGAWFWYTAPIYPYPTAVSDYYYEDPSYDEAGPTWWYCYNPSGYYPYVPYCYGAWRPVPAQGSGYDESGPDQGPPPDQQQYDYQQAPPPGYDQGPPPGYGQGPQPGYNQGSPPPGYDQGPPPGYDEQGPPPGEQGAPNGQRGSQ